MRPPARGAKEGAVTADVPLEVIGVLLWRGFAASWGGAVSFPFIHTRDMPFFRLSPMPANALRGGRGNHCRGRLFMGIAMIGTGYVGLGSAACFADFGHQVTLVAQDAARVARPARGEIPI